MSGDRWEILGAILFALAMVGLLVALMIWPIVDWRRRGPDGTFAYEDYRFWKILWIVGFLTGTLFLIGGAYLWFVVRPERMRARRA